MSVSDHIRIFLASSAELVTERDQLEIAIARFNEQLPIDSPRFRVVRWEHHEAQLRPQGSQQHYNEFLVECDIFLFIYHGKVGMYSRQEFETAWAAMVERGKPTIYVYHKTAPLSSETQRPRDVQSVKDFEDRLRELQQFAVHYDNLDRFKAHFLDQLRRFFLQNLKEKVDSLSSIEPESRLDPPMRRYRMFQIHQLLDAAYDDILLRQFVQFHFPKVFQSLGAMQGKQLVLSQLLDYARRHLQLWRILDIVSEEHAELYSYYGEYW